MYDVIYGRLLTQLEQPSDWTFFQSVVDPGDVATYDPAMAGSKKSEVDQLEQLISLGDYREARKNAKRLAGDAGLSKEDKEKVEHCLKVTGNDSYVIGGFLFTFAVLVFLAVKYVL